MRILIPALVGLCGLLAACSNPPIDSTTMDYYVNEHLELVPTLPASSLTESVDQKFQRVFADFKETMTAENLRDLYAQDLYFNDTLVTLNSIDELVAYMEKTSASTVAATVEITDMAKSDSDYYLRWSMDMEFVVRGKTIRSRSIGMTQLRFNEQGKVILHQDYWDSANAFCQHLPIVGGLVKRVRKSLH